MDIARETYHNHNTLVKYQWRYEDPENVIDKSAAKKYSSNLGYRKLSESNRKPS